MLNKHRPSELALVRPTLMESSTSHQHGEAFCAELQLVASCGGEAILGALQRSTEQFSTTDAAANASAQSQGLIRKCPRKELR